MNRFKYIDGYAKPHVEFQAGMKFRLKPGSHLIVSGLPMDVELIKELIEDRGDEGIHVLWTYKSAQRNEIIKYSHKIHTKWLRKVYAEV